jgi:hypothetical protein
MTNYQRIRIFLFLLLGACLFKAGAFGSIKTPAEAVNFAAYSQYEEISTFLSRLDDMSSQLVVRVAGRTLPAKNFPAQDLFLCILTEEGAGSAAELNRDKPTLYFVAAKHGNEQSAKEAALQFLRDVAVGELNPLLSRINILILPQANPYGSRFDRRRNEQDLDLNRDHVKLESPEVEIITRIFRRWMPEVTMDIHEKGDDYYRVNVGCVSNANIHPDLLALSRRFILKEMEQALSERKITFHEYLLTQEMGIDSSAGVSYSAEELEGRQTMYRFSTTDLNDGRNGPGIYETLSFIQEITSLHDLPTLKERTGWQYWGLRTFTESVARRGQEINSLVRRLRAGLLARAARVDESDLVHLRMTYARNPQQPRLSFKKYIRASSPVRGILRVDKKAGESVTASDMEPPNAPPQYTVEGRTTEFWYPSVKPALSVVRPLGYIIPSSHRAVVDALLKHGIVVEVFTEDTSFTIEAYRAKEVVQAEYDYLPPERIEVEKSFLMPVFKKGDFYVRCAQPAANLIPCLLEPQSQYGLIRYRMYDLVPEKGDIFPFYRTIEERSLPVVPFRNWDR